MDKFILAHLSDIHFSGTDTALKLMNNLKDDLQSMKDKIGRVDSIIITGDCVDQGKMENFNLFEKKLQEISKGCKVNKNRVFSVPGNHDASRKNEWLYGVKESKKDDIDLQLQTVQKEISPLFPEYNMFVEKFSKVRDGIGVKCVKVENMYVRIIMLNSSWSTLINNKYGELHIGDTQLLKIRREFEASKGKKPKLTIACLHHPLDWFAYDERLKLKKLLYEDCGVDILLHGHIHEAEFASTSNIDLATKTFCTGISYVKTGEKSSRRDGMRYSIYEINITTQTINIYLRATNNRGEFVDDNTLYSKVAKGGFFSLPLGNPFNCIMPIESVNNAEKNNVFLEQSFVKLMLEKEDLLFKFYCGIAERLEEMIANLDKEQARYQLDWEKDYGSVLGSEEQKKKFEKDFYRYVFELYCMYIIQVLKALFFQNHNQVRFLIRIYDKISNQHIAEFAEGVYVTAEDIKNIKNFKWGEGMIYYSYQSKSALLKSANMDLHLDGNSTRWLDYLTVTPSNIRIKSLSGGWVPLISLNIAISDKENERCLYALAQSTLYDKLQELFALFERKVYSLAKLYDTA